jgi:hypothetical protein
VLSAPEFLGSCVVLSPSCLPASGLVCPPGSTRDHVAHSGNEEQTYCKCLPGYVARGTQCVSKLPSVDPAFSQGPDQTTFLRDELERLQSRKQKLEREIEKLNQLREGQQEYLKEMNEMREQLVYDSVRDLVALAGGKEVVKPKFVAPPGKLRRDQIG